MFLEKGRGESHVTPEIFFTSLGGDMHSRELLLVIECICHELTDVSA